MARGAVIIVALALVGAGLAWWLLRGGDGSKSGAHAPGKTSGLDVEKYRASYRERLARARQMIERRKRAMADTGTTKPETHVSFHGMARGVLVDPVCILGPAELCAMLDDPITDCDDGDGQACLAVGQYLADTPPRPLTALIFFVLSCQTGDQEACARVKAIKEGPARPCEKDVFACAWKAYKAHDLEKLDEVCSLGVADACSVLEWEFRGDPPRARAYLETSCQLGSAFACGELGRRLSPGCKPEPDQPCYPPEPEQATAARTIACEAGWEDACS